MHLPLEGGGLRSVLDGHLAPEQVEAATPGWSKLARALVELKEHYMIRKKHTNDILGHSVFFLYSFDYHLLAEVGYLNYCLLRNMKTTKYALTIGWVTSNLTWC